MYKDFKQTYDSIRNHYMLANIPAKKYLNFLIIKKWSLDLYPKLIAFVF